MLLFLVPFVAALQAYDAGLAAATLTLPSFVPEQSDDSAVDAELRRRDRPSARLDAEGSGSVRRFLQDWGGARGRLESLGFGIEALYSADGSWLLGDAAVAGDDVVVRGLLDVTFTLDTGPCIGLHGGTLHVGLQWLHGVDATPRLDVLQPISNIDADRRLQVGRVWYEQAFEATDTRVRIGKIDGNSQFAYADAAAQFLHSSMGFSPTIFLMPSYPDSAFGASVTQGLGAFELRIGAFDGAFADGTKTGQRGPGTLFDGDADFFYIGEVDLEWETGRAAVGAWSSTATLARFDGGGEGGTHGTYAVLEQRVWGTRDGSEQDVSAFVQFGQADAAVSPFSEHLGLAAR